MLPATCSLLDLAGTVLLLEGGYDKPARSAVYLKRFTLLLKLHPDCSRTIQL